MKRTSLKKCPKCGKLGLVLTSNNPISPGICLECLQNFIDYKDLKAADYFCRTYNIPFDPNKWIKIAESVGIQVFETYTEIIMDERPKDIYSIQEDNGDSWAEVNKLWNNNLKNKDYLNEIESIKEGWIAQMNIKWGPQYEFTDYLKLEHLYNSTARSVGTTSPLTLDIIKKIAVISVQMDHALENGEIKEAGDYAKMHRDLIKSAGLEEMIDVGGGENINTVADLCNYLEEKGFQFSFYDKVPRDVVDKTIADMQEWTVNLVTNATGIKQEYEMIKDAYSEKMEQEKTDVATALTTLDDLIENKRKAINAEVDDTLESDDFELEVPDD